VGAAVLSTIHWVRRKPLFAQNVLIVQIVISMLQGTSFFDISLYILTGVVFIVKATLCPYEPPKY
jgi:hypothetical protein